VGGVVFDGEIKGEAVFNKLRVIECFGYDDVEGAVVIGHDGGHTLFGKRNFPEAFDAEIKGEPDEKSGEERKNNNRDEGFDFILHLDE